MTNYQEQTPLIHIPPFNQLSAEELDVVMQAVDIAYFKKDDFLIKQGESPEYLYILLKGLVHEINENEELISFYTAQDCIDAVGLLEGESKNSFLANQEVVCYLLPKSTFLTTIGSNSAFKNTFHQNLTTRLNNLLEQRQNKEMASFMLAKISDIYMQPPVFVNADASIYEAVQKMQAHKVSAVLVQRGDEVGIFTDTDIRKHVVLGRVSVDAELGQFSTYNLISLQVDDFLFNARLTMTKHSVKRLLVYENDNIIGLLDQLDLFSYFSNDSRLIAVQIERATTKEQLKKACDTVLTMIQSLYDKGVKIRYVSQLVTELNRRIFHKLYEFIAPPDLLLNSCLLVMGSEGREEQILRTDQDNAIILRDGYTCENLDAITQEFTETLVQFGYPPCNGKIMVNNPYWCRPLKGFQDQIYGWIDHPNEEALMNLAIFYDAHCVAGDAELLKTAKNYLFKLLIDNKIFYAHFARPTLAFETPLNWFENFIVEKNHNRKQLNIKKGGIFPIVHGVRSLAIENRLTTTNTIERIRLLQKNGVLQPKFAIELIEAFSFMSWVRLHAELLEINNGEDYNNYVDPDTLNKLERDLLKDSFKIVNEFKKLITHHFKLNLVS
ncbi:putative nucleotidyltransferase substrate binding domain-containing protein [Beggiatoa leptomitoformis]|uniref:CBS domain-containing protein n=1 Tax=Beggiatoa leptomitoformis TaxID=288004 RepID=A0A2N9Y9Y2_9GAMM|nr:putative nucleotidyltransferase substrate binding domain-containing protein [Beggiatoa leptomitoformis]ALG67305.1 CBS domain-containing protein [Beggiatoa leptomitoformis]AUI67264.1 CBS domain-containing protein [Beggiatoa leptomitoformis]